MANYTQANRPIRVETPLGADELLITGVSGHEAVSATYRYRLDLMSLNDAISGDDLLRKAVAVAIVQEDGSDRWIHGTVSRFAQLGKRDEITFYEAEIVPDLWFLSLGRDCRIFQEQTVPEIVQAVLKENKITDFSFLHSGSFEKREYCVQYQESDLDFVQRLLEEEGLHYRFRHSKTKHEMLIGDAQTPVDDVPGPATIRFAAQPDIDEDIIRELRREDSVYLGEVTLNDYDFEKPTLSLISKVEGKGIEEVYDYPGKFKKPGDGERYARIRLEAEEALRASVRGEGTCRGFAPGTGFTLEDHYRADSNRRYRLLEVALSFQAGGYRSWDDGDFESRCSFVAIPDDTPYRPQRRTRRPIVRGTQTALVVGPSGEEIHVDKYGRVKVQFYWDREGKKNEKSSCWVRVSSAWAGKKWGAIHIPRIGQEVIVDYLEGDPDLPIITGRVYNADQMPPYDLPKNQTQSGIKSRSSKGGGTEDFNEIRMEDLKGKELLYIHAQKDKQVMVENDRTEEVGNDETITIKGNRKETVEKNETIAIKGKRTETVDKDETITIKGKRTEKVDKAEKIKIGMKRARQVGTDETLKVGTKRTSKIGTSDTLKVGTKLTVKANVEILLKVGANSIKIDNTGITIKGLMVKIQGTAMAEMKAPMTTVKGDAMLQAKAPLSQVNGDGLLMLKGGLTMIN